MSEISSGSEVSGDSKGTGSEVSGDSKAAGSAESKALDSKLDENCESYAKEGKPSKDAEAGKAEVSEGDKPGKKSDAKDKSEEELDSKLDEKYNDYMEGKKEKDAPEKTENGLHELSNKDKKEVCSETGWSKDVVDNMKSKEEVEIYKNAKLKEEEVDGRKCLVRSDLDMKQKDEFGKTNRERMADGNAPLSKRGETIELHHIGQKQDSPLAELTTKEHRGKGNDTVLHDKTKESEIDRPDFAKDRKSHWECRSEK